MGALASPEEGRGTCSFTFGYAESPQRATYTFGSSLDVIARNIALFAIIQSNEIDGEVGAAELVWKLRYGNRKVAEPLSMRSTRNCSPDGPPVILLHGSMSASLGWLGDAPRWVESRRIMAVYLPGEAGFSQARRPALSSDEPEKWLDAELAGLKIEKIAIIGMSLGGWFALRYAAQFPGRVMAIACIAPGG